MVCKEWEQQCIGPDLYECHQGKWVLVEGNSPQCPVTPPPPPPPPVVYTCSICGSTFNSQAGLDAHIASAHPPPPPPPPEPPVYYPASIVITAPSSAKKGATVNASVTVKNVSAYNYSYKATIYAVPDRYPDYVIGSIDQIITSGSSVTRNVSFTMPDCNVTIFIWLERWATDRWVYDGSASKVVSLEVPATYHLSILVPSWAAGGYVEPGSGDYPANTTITLTATPLSGYKFTSWGGDASGTSTTYNLYMNSDKYVEAYFEKIPVPEYKGSIARKELEYDSVRGTIPVY